MPPETETQETQTQETETQETQTQETQTPDLSLPQYLSGALKDNETLSRFKDVPSLASSYLELRTKQGEALFKPGKDSSAEDISKFQQSLGAPVNPTDYGLKHDAFEDMPLDEGVVTKLMEMGHAKGISVEHMNDIYQFYGDSLIEMANSDVNFINEAHLEAEANLKKEWVGKYDENRAVIKVIKEGVFSKETIAFFEENRVGDNVPFMKDMLSLAQRMSEKSILGTTKAEGGSIETPLSLKEEAKKIQHEPDYWTSHVKQARVTEIFKEIEKLKGGK